MPTLIHRKSLIIIIIVVVLGGGVVFFLSQRSKNNTDTDKTGDAISQSQLEQISADTDKFRDDLTSSIEKQAETIKSVEDLDKIDEQDRANVGFAVIAQKIEAGDTLEAKKYIDYFMLRNDNAGLDATIYCYRIASEPSEKQKCVDRANEIAVEQGLIQQKDTLPERFFDGGVGEVEQG